MLKEDFSTLAFLIGKKIDMMAITLPKLDLFQFFLNEGNKSGLSESLRLSGFPRREVCNQSDRRVYLIRHSECGFTTHAWQFDASIYEFEQLVKAAEKNSKNGDASKHVSDNRLSKRLRFTGLENLLNLLSDESIDLDDPVIKSVLKDFNASMLNSDEASDIFGNMSFDSENLTSGGFVKMDFNRANFGSPDFIPQRLVTPKALAVFDF